MTTKYRTRKTHVGILATSTISAKNHPRQRRKLKQKKQPKEQLKKQRTRSPRL